MMTPALPKLITCDEFIAWYPNDSKRYELHQGVIFEMPQHLAIMKILLVF